MSYRPRYTRPYYRACTLIWVIIFWSLLYLRPPYSSPFDHYPLNLSLPFSHIPLDSSRRFSTTCPIHPFHSLLFHQLHLIVSPLPIQSISFLLSYSKKPLSCKFLIHPFIVLSFPSTSNNNFNLLSPQRNTQHQKMASTRTYASPSTSFTSHTVSQDAILDEYITKQ